MRTSAHRRSCFGRAKYASKARNRDSVSSARYRIDLRFGRAMTGRIAVTIVSGSRTWTVSLFFNCLQRQVNSSPGACVGYATTRFFAFLAHYACTLPPRGRIDKTLEPEHGQIADAFSSGSQERGRKFSSALMPRARESARRGKANLRFQRAFLAAPRVFPLESPGDPIDEAGNILSARTSTLRKSLFRGQRPSRRKTLGLRRLRPSHLDRTRS